MAIATRPEKQDRGAEGQTGTMAVIHATTIALRGNALVLTGASGSGKSGLALELLALGAGLVSDDRTVLTVTDEGALIATAAPHLSGRIEARGIGILAAEPVARAIVTAVVDLDRTESERLPPHRTTELLGIPLPLLHKVDSPYFAAGLLQYLKGRRTD